MIFSPMQWSGNITVDGPIYKFNGTVQVRLYRDQKENGTQAACQTDFGFCTQEIHAQILKANPEFKLMDVSHKDSVKPHQLTVSVLNWRLTRPRLVFYTNENQVC